MLFNNNYSIPYVHNESFGVYLKNQGKEGLFPLRIDRVKLYDGGEGHSYSRRTVAEKDVCQVPRHHCIVIDQLKDHVGYLDKVAHFTQKILTIEEYRDPHTMVTVITLDHSGPQIKYQRAKVTEMLASPLDKDSLFGQRHLDEQPTEYNSESSVHSLIETLDMIERLKREGELTIISLNTTGGLSEEITEVDRSEILKYLRALEDDYFALNCLCYSQSPPSSLYNELSLVGGGVTLHAQGLKIVYDSFFHSVIRQGERTISLEMNHEGNCRGWMLINRSTQRVTCGSRDQALVGVSPKDDYELFKFSHLDERKSKPFEGLEALSARDMKHHQQLALLALSHFYLTVEGHLNRAKYALFSSQHQGLCSRHSKALTADEIVLWRRDLEEHCLHTESSLNTPVHHNLSQKKITLDGRSSKPSLHEVFSLIKRYKSAVYLSKSELANTYQLRGLKTQGDERDDHAGLISPTMRYQPRSNDDLLELYSVKLNRFGAHLSLTTKERIELINTRDKVIYKVGGVNLEELSVFRSYTLFAEGEVHLPILKLKVQHKRLFRQLRAWGLVKGAYHPNKWSTLTLTHLRVIDPPSVKWDPNELYRTSALSKFVLSFINCLLGDYSDRFTQRQLSALRSRHIHRDLSFSPPKRSAYYDLDRAEAEGSVKQERSTRIELESQELGLLSHLPSAMSFIRSTYRMNQGGGIHKIKGAGSCIPSFYFQYKIIT